jgi:hypothetical protein
MNVLLLDAAHVAAFVHSNVSGMVPHWAKRLCTVHVALRHLAEAAAGFGEHQRAKSEADREQAGFAGLAPREDGVDWAGSSGVARTKAYRGGSSIRRQSSRLFVTALTNTALRSLFEAICASAKDTPEYRKAIARLMAYIRGE